jgi:hypothetical protein
MTIRFQPTLLRSGRFGKLFTRDVDVQICVQPLFVEHLPIGGNHNVVFVATTQKSIAPVVTDRLN